MRLFLATLIVLLLSGCGLLPEIAHQPVVQNPFPQLSRVAVAPFFNLSDEPTVDQDRFAIAYFNELQAVPGFEVVPLNVVKQAMINHDIRLNEPGAARRLAQVLDVDAVVVGAVTEYSPYYPPKLGLQVEWWSANPGFHPIPAGYGLPWGTPEEEYIPTPLVYEAELALAKEQLATQTPLFTPEPIQAPPAQPRLLDAPADEPRRLDASGARPASHEESIAPEQLAGNANAAAKLPPDWPDARGFIPPGPSCERPPLTPSDRPVLRHTKIYHSDDSQFTQSLANYEYFRDDARFSGWQGYLQRSDDFIRFCCHMHISEMLTARGGAGETRVVWRWSNDR